MEYEARKPCKECPFRKASPKGWLGPDSAQEVMDKVNREGDYICHMTTAGKAEIDGRGPLDTPGLKYCTGSIMYANTNFKRYRDPERQKLQDEMSKMKCRTKVLRNAKEFMEHHTLC